MLTEKEINDGATEYQELNILSDSAYLGFKDGAKWAIEQLKKQRCGNCNHHFCHPDGWSFCDMSNWDETNAPNISLMKCDNWQAKEVTK